MKLGVCYYPEHWPEERRPIDARLISQAGHSLVRIADFAWALIEPRESQFTWDCLDRVVEMLPSEGLQVILCTPTASPPPCLRRAYPEILPVDAEGRRRRSVPSRIKPFFAPANAFQKLSCDLSRISRRSQLSFLERRSLAWVGMFIPF